ncbi:MAG: discoidin domain-containing protein [Gemmatimonadota bacterium]
MAAQRVVSKVAFSLTMLALTATDAVAVPPSNAAQQGWTPVWVQCATEGSICRIPGTRRVRYGIETSYAGSIATDSVSCSNAVFGDPAPGVQKHCTYLTNEPGVATAAQNVALGKRAVQSSTEFGGDASRAVDGRTDGVFNNGSVTHTANEKGAWWMVDLGGEYLIESIILHNRTDCCSERLNVSVVVTSHEVWPAPLSTIAYRSYIGIIPQQKKVDVASHAVVHGRYVYVYLMGLATHLSLAEVEVMGTPSTRQVAPTPTPPPDITPTPPEPPRRLSMNLSQGKRAVQSSTDYGGSADRAVDGNIDGDFFRGSVTHTGAGRQEWWMVDLGDNFAIDSIVVYNRTDCCNTRLAPTRVYVTRTEGWPSMSQTFEAYAKVGVPTHQNFDVAGTNLYADVDGRFVYVVQYRNQEVLSLAEVMVWGKRRRMYGDPP